VRTRTWEDTSAPDLTGYTDVRQRDRRAQIRLWGGNVLALGLLCAVVFGLAACISAGIEAGKRLLVAHLPDRLPPFPLPDPVVLGFALAAGIIIVVILAQAAWDQFEAWREEWRRR